MVATQTQSTQWSEHHFGKVFTNLRAMQDECYAKVALLDAAICPNRPDDALINAARCKDDGSKTAESMQVSSCWTMFSVFSPTFNLAMRRQHHTAPDLHRALAQIELPIQGLN